MSPLFLLAALSLGQADSVKVNLGRIPPLSGLAQRPLRGVIDLPNGWGGQAAKNGVVYGEVLDDDKRIGEFQLFSSSLSGKGRDWYARIDSPPVGGKVEFRVKASGNTIPFSFEGDWKSTRTLLDSKGPILAVFCEPYNPANAQTKDATFKTYTHVFDPEGKEKITKGAGGKFPHHRGLFYGFMKTTYQGGLVDTWHCRDGVHLNLTGDGKEELGPLAARVTLPVGWYGKKDDLFANEERQFTVLRVGKTFVIDFDSRLTPVSGTIKVDGDPQHAGFHFRASGEVADTTAKETVYVRPSGADKPGATRNWPERKDHINLPWNAMNFSANGNRYSVTYVNHPSNPGESRFSERDYGRFGCYFVSEASQNKPLTVQYRVVIRRGNIDQATAQADRDAFAR